MSRLTKSIRYSLFVIVVSMMIIGLAKFFPKAEALRNDADLNHDTIVNDVDANIVVDAIKNGQNTADVNRDGATNLTDFSIVMNSYTR